MKLCYEDDAVVVCEKPEGILSQADSGGGESAVSLLAAQTGGEIYPVHRLDRTTGGLMVFAKTPRAAAELSKQITMHGLVKEYIALVHGVPPEPEGTMTDLLFYDRRAGKSYVVQKQRAGVKQAELFYQILKTDGSGENAVSRLLIRLKTGRTHQIRVQFASRGMPLVGDRRYGAADGKKRIYLWSYRLAFTHPGTGERMEFTVPPDFDNI